MKKLLVFLLILALLGCAAEPVATTTAPEATVPETTVPAPTVPETTVPQTTAAPTTVPPHSDLYLEGLDVEEVLRYFHEVVLQSEYSDGTGDPSVIQKWLQPIRYCIFGEPTEEDLVVLNGLFDQLNQIPGFPGIRAAGEEEPLNLTISFLDQESLLEIYADVVGDSDAWGACQFWYYTDTNEIYDGRVGYLTEIDQIYRNSILLEEIVNVLSITDTEERTDSIVYQYSNDNLCLSDVDWLILKLLYHPSIECGMDMEQCEAVIRELYY